MTTKAGRRRMKPWRLEKKCTDCPFDTKGPGLHLRKSLGRERWREILSSPLNNQHFPCHKTTRETGNGTNLVCAGAIEWQDAHGVSANYVRVRERLEYFTRMRKEPTP